MPRGSPLCGTSGYRFTRQALLLQPQLCSPLTPRDVGAFGLRLVAAAPSGPVQEVRRHRGRLPHERKEQTPHLRDGERQQIDGRAAGVYACCFLLVRPPCRPCYARCRTTVR